MREVLATKKLLHQGPLVLVNRDHPLQMEKSPHLVPVDEQRPHLLLEKLTARLLMACMEDVGGKESIVPVSGWRSQKEQQSLWEETLKKEGEAFTQKYVAYPGCSEHQTGLAIDLGEAADYIDFVRPYFSHEGVCGRFRQAAAKYGFIERYQEEKKTITGIGAEPWHFRYVGAPHAQIIEYNHLCLEEYTEFLKQGPYDCTLENGQNAKVYYVPYEGEDTAISLPESCCQIAGNNVDGFIITVWGSVG